MSQIVATPPLTDAKKWPDTVTVQFRAVYDHTDPDGTRTTITGTASFTYSRAKLGDTTSAGKLLAFAVGNLTDQGTFCAVQCALGGAPGWLATFNNPPTQKDAFTYTVTQPPSSSGDTPPPQTSQIDASCTLSAFCAPIAPDRYIYADASLFAHTLVGLNSGLGTDDAQQGDPSDDPNLKKSVAYTCDFVSGGTAATDNDPATGNVYRLTFPSDAAILTAGSDYDAFSVTYNGAVLRPTTSASYYIASEGNVFALLLGLPDPDSGSFVPCNTLRRSPYVLEVQMANYGDTLGAGTISYRTWNAYQPLDSTLTVNGRTETLDNPFSLSAVHHEGDPDNAGDGYDWDVSFGS